ncbi:Cell division GTPase FtsZ [Haloplanus vescus]|uniref:Tubulin-like protein CetZ n=1 Tax=Haloplanus vescus TaxID=555874 RepID=A0A1H3WM96_9EURY|nr:tubulin/FtsZ family protein [Haloplanus vescus]SDZ88266.1 Cell division GTPase FtsZ [Haloplanus vescus]
MKSVLIGVGQAGGKVTAALSDFDARHGFDAVTGSLAINSARSDLQSLPLDTVLIGGATVNGHGVGGDNELGAEVMRDDIQEVLGAIDGRTTAEAEAIFVVAGLGGGTGSGGAPVLVEELQRIYDIPVYGLGILPGRDEGSLYQVNAGRSLKTLIREADATLLIDNDAWRSSGESLESGYEAINERIARRVGLLVASGEAVDGVGESVVDSSEVINTLRGVGVATLGFAAADASSDTAANVNVVTSTTRRAVRSGLSLPDTTRAERGLLVVAGRPDAISRKGVEKARSWLETELETMEVRGGDFPLRQDRLASLVLLGGVADSDRLDDFLERAREAAREKEDDDDESSLVDDRIDGLL